MPKRSPSGQSTHDQRVRQEAERLKKQGWNVQADLPGHNKPKAIGQNNKRPDIQATKRGHTKLIEVETPSSVKADNKQQSTFRRSAAQRSNTSFETIVTDE